MPERLDLKLEAPAAALSPQETQTIKATGRYLYGPPAADLAIEGDILVKPSKKDVEGYPGFQFGQADETIEPVRKPLDAATTTDADGVAQVAITLPPVTQTAKPLEASVILRLREVRWTHHRAHHHRSRRPEAAAHRHQAAVQGHRSRREADRLVRGRRAR